MREQQTKAQAKNKHIMNDLIALERKKTATTILSLSDAAVIYIVPSS